MKSTAVAVGGLVLCLAGVSYADLAYVGTPNGVAVVASTGTVSSSGINDANLGAIDNVDGLTLSGNGAGGTATVDFQLNKPVTGPFGESTFLLFADVANGVTLTSLSIGTGIGGAYSNLSTVAPGLLLTTGRNRFVGAFTGGQTYTTFRAVFTLGAAGQLSVDAVSNPEPGTLALFGLGAMTLGGFALRRRKARAAAPRA